MKAPMHLSTPRRRLSVRDISRRQLHEAVARLHRALRKALTVQQVNELTMAAGRLTTNYLLENRIRQPARLFMNFLPMSLAARFLGSAIRAWTFAGSG